MLAHVHVSAPSAPFSASFRSHKRSILSFSLPLSSPFVTPSSVPPTRASKYLLFTIDIYIFHSDFFPLVRRLRFPHPCHLFFSIGSFSKSEREFELARFRSPYYLLIDTLFQHRQFPFPFIPSAAPTAPEYPFTFLHVSTLPLPWSLVPSDVVVNPPASPRRSFFTPNFVPTASHSIPMLPPLPLASRWSQTNLVLSPFVQQIAASLSLSPSPSPPPPPSSCTPCRADRTSNPSKFYLVLHRCFCSLHRIEFQPSPFPGKSILIPPRPSLSPLRFSIFFSPAPRFPLTTFSLCSSQPCSFSTVLLFSPRFPFPFLSRPTVRAFLSVLRDPRLSRPLFLCPFPR